MVNDVTVKIIFIIYHTDEWRTAKIISCSINTFKALVVVFNIPEFFLYLAIYRWQKR